MRLYTHIRELHFDLLEVAPYAFARVNPFYPDESTETIDVYHGCINFLFLWLESSGRSDHRSGLIIFL